MRLVSRATWTSGDPVSPSLFANSLMTSARLDSMSEMLACFLAVFVATWFPSRIHCTARRGLFTRALWYPWPLHGARQDISRAFVRPNRRRRARTDALRGGYDYQARTTRRPCGLH